MSGALLISLANCESNEFSDDVLIVTYILAMSTVWLCSSTTVCLIWWATRQSRGALLQVVPKSCRKRFADTRVVVVRLSICSFEVHLWLTWLSVWCNVVRLLGRATVD